jgi:Fe-S cluster assembly protein SufD
LILLEAGAEAQVSERFLSLNDGLYLNNGLTQVQLGKGARLCHYRCQQEARQAYHFSRLQVRLDAGAHYESHQLALGARIGRSELSLEYRGEEASCALQGLALAHDGQLLDFHTDVEHAVPTCTTRQRFKAILAGRGRGVFSGCIRVHRQAQHSDAHMRSDNLLLSRNAEMDALPQLEIYADDVKCGHGATVGQLDPVALFYLRSRGVPESQARHLLTQGFAVDLLEAMAEGPQRRWMETALTNQLEALHV